jgi:hypothetical protein
MGSVGFHFWGVIGAFLIVHLVGSSISSRTVANSSPAAESSKSVQGIDTLLRFAFLAFSVALFKTGFAATLPWSRTGGVQLSTGSTIA